MSSSTTFIEFVHFAKIKFKLQHEGTQRDFTEGSKKKKKKQSPELHNKIMLNIKLATLRLGGAL